MNHAVGLDLSLNGLEVGELLSGLGLVNLLEAVYKMLSARQLGSGRRESWEVATYSGRGGALGFLAGFSSSSSSSSSSALTFLEGVLRLRGVAVFLALGGGGGRGAVALTVLGSDGGLLLLKLLQMLPMNGG